MVGTAHPTRTAVINVGTATPADPRPACGSSATAPIAIDFAVPVAHGPGDNIQNVAFYFGMNRFVKMLSKPFFAPIVKG